MTTQPPPGEIPAGWYPDPEGNPLTRYWDGSAWTDQTGPAAPAAAPALGSAFAPVQFDLEGRPVSPSSRLAAALLCGFLGVLGVHRFYVGKIGTGVLMILTGGGLGIWAIVDLILILVGKFRDKQERVLLNW